MTKGRISSAGFRTFDHQRIRAGSHQTLGKHQSRRKTNQFGAAVLDRLGRRTRRQASCENDMRHLMFVTHLDQLHQLRVHGDQVDAKRLAGERLGGGNLGIEQRRRHRTAGDHTESAGIGDRSDKISLAHPTHRTAKNGVFTAEERGATRPQSVQSLTRGHQAASRP